MIGPGRVELKLEFDRPHGTEPWSSDFCVERAVSRVDPMSVSRVVRRVCVVTTLGLVLLCQIAIWPSEGQTNGYSDVVGPGEPPVLLSKRDQLDSVLGKEVRTRVEGGIGRIIDLLTDRNGQVQAAVIEFGGFLGIGARKIAVEWSALRFEGDHRQPAVILEMTRDQLRLAPEYKPGAPAVVHRASE